MSDTIDTKFEKIDKEYYCGHDTAAEYVIKDLSAWQDLWNQTNLNKSSQPPIPKIDFSKEMILGAYLGQRSSGGYDIEISKVQEKDNCLEVYIKESTPNPLMIVSGGLTQPYHLVKTAVTDKEVKFNFTPEFWTSRNGGTAQNI